MPAEQPLRLYPFSNGSQFGDWCASNCDTCEKSGDADAGRASTCSVFDALHEAFFGDGSVGEETARRMGFLDHRNHYNWPCREHSPPFGNAADHCDACAAAAKEQQR